MEEKGRSRKAEMLKIRTAQRDLKSRMENGDFKALNPFIYDRGIIKAGERIDKSRHVHHEGHIVLPTEFEVRAVSARAINQRGKRGSVTYSTDRENEVGEIFIISLRLIGREGKDTS